MPTRDADRAGNSKRESPLEPASTAFSSRRRDRALKSEAVLQTAAALFLEQGYERTLMTEVAQRLSITKPALYNYFRGKNDVLSECYRIGQEQLEALIATISASDLSGLERLRRFIAGYLGVITRDFGKCLVQVDDRVLDEDYRRSVRATKKRIELEVRGYIRQGIEDGSVRACDPQLATLAIFGALNGVTGWYDPIGRVRLDRLTTHYIDQLTAGIVEDHRDSS